jgi:hypothetical protein
MGKTFCSMVLCAALVWPGAAFDLDSREPEMIAQATDTEDFELIEVDAERSELVIGRIFVKNVRDWQDETKQHREERRIPISGPRYENAEYGFSAALPADWEGNTVIVAAWEGDHHDENGESDGTETGPSISIRHPSWTEADPYQDIPIMIFTLGQWEETQSEDAILTVGAAPFPPRELARNANYVFALPARYNFAYPRGFEQVEKIIKGGAVKAISPDRRRQS